MSSHKHISVFRFSLKIAAVMAVLLSVSVAFSQDHVQYQHGSFEQHPQQYVSENPGQEYFQYSNGASGGQAYDLGSPSEHRTVQHGGAPPQNKLYCGIDQNSKSVRGKEPSWRNTNLIPFESFGPGEYVGPSRTPHVPEYPASR